MDGQYDPAEGEDVVTVARQNGRLFDTIFDSKATLVQHGMFAELLYKPRHFD
jgi:hypothetical protein